MSTLWFFSCNLSENGRKGIEELVQELKEWKEEDDEKANDNAEIEEMLTYHIFCM